MRRSSHGLRGQREMSESGSVFVIGSGIGAPTCGVLDVTSGVIVVLLEVKADGHIG